MKLLIVLTLISFSHAIAQQALPKMAPSPKTNLISPEKVALGKALFFDPRLSTDGTISCNSCHNVMAGGEDNRPGSVGVRGQVGGRSAPTVWNAAFQSVQFWDGRAATLEDQAIGPITNPIEMGMPNHSIAVERIRNIPGYKGLFKAAFGSQESIHIDNVAKAIASFERTLITPNSRFDKYIQGEKGALSKKELAGFEKMKTTGCYSCHSGKNFSGPELQVGTGFFMKFPTIAGTEYEKKYNLTADLGRYEVTKKESDKNFWRVPTLRNIALTAPYFHNGSVADLSEAVKVMAKTQLNKDLSPDEVDEIVAFLNTLSGDLPKILAPQLPPTHGTSFFSKSL